MASISISHNPQLNQHVYIVKTNIILHIFTVQKESLFFIQWLALAPQMLHTCTCTTKNFDHMHTQSDMCTYELHHEKSCLLACKANKDRSACNPQSTERLGFSL